MTTTYAGGCDGGEELVVDGAFVLTGEGRGAVGSSYGHCHGWCLGSVFVGDIIELFGSQ